MLTVEQVKDNISNYRIKNGIVIDKSSNQPLQDEDKILEVKSSVLIYLNAHAIHKADIHLNGKETKSKDECIVKSMEQYSVHNEKSNVGINKFVNELLNSNGHYEEDMSGNDLNESKFSMFSDQNRDFGISYLKYKLREKGLDLSNFKLNLSEIKQQNGKSSGQYKVIIDYDINKYEKIQKQEIKNKPQLNVESSKEKAVVQPAQPVEQNVQTTLNEIERQMQIAKQNNDIDAFNYWSENLTNIQNRKQEEQLIPKAKETVENNNQASTKMNESNYYYNQLLSAINRRRSSNNLTDEEKQQIVGEIYYNMGYLAKYTSTEAEIMELISKVVNDLNNDDFEKNIQNQIINEIQEEYNKRKNKSIIETSIEEQSSINQLDNISEQPIEAKSDSLNFSVMIDQLKTQNNQISSEYKSMLSDGYIDDNELAILINRLKALSDNAAIIKSMVTNQSQEALINSIIEMIDQEITKMTTMQDGINNTRKIL